MVRTRLRPVENCAVATFADDKNSSAISLNDTQPGDIITMLNDGNESEHDHILIVTEIEFENSQSSSKPTKIHYAHAVAYPEDGLLGTGVKQGVIEISADSNSITDGLWSENGSTTKAERIFNRAKKSKTEIRRLRWF